MKKRICALILSCMVAFTGMPVSAAEDTAEEIIIDSDVELPDSENPESEQAEDRLGSDPTLGESQEETEVSEDWESEWMERYGLTKTDEGDYQLIDEEGNIFIYNSDDPELFKYYPIEEEEQELIPMELSEDGEWELLEGAANPDPHVFKLNASHKYSYPRYYKASDDSKRVSIHYGIDVSYHQGSISESTYKRL